MARRCAVCGKGPVAGGSFSHSHVRTRRRFLPNLQKVRIKVEGAERRAQVCTACLRSRRASRVR
ncbi:MAG: 50S ribosomal protein L28 [Armatimonadetes bacterium]|nr:50S ribosomal protein L28 [Armatimonadota bacterium]